LRVNPTPNIGASANQPTRLMRPNRQAAPLDRF